MVERVIDEISHAFRWYLKVNNKHIKFYDKSKESSYLNYWDVNNFYGWTMSQKLPASDVCVENRCKFYEVFRKNYIHDSDLGYFLKVNIQNSEELHEIHNDLSFLTETMKIEEVKKLAATCMI